MTIAIVIGVWAFGSVVLGLLLAQILRLSGKGKWPFGRKEKVTIASIAAVMSLAGSSSPVFRAAQVEQRSSRVRTFGAAPAQPGSALRSVAAAREGSVASESGPSIFLRHKPGSSLGFDAGAQLALGTATAQSVACPSGSGSIVGTCYQLTVSACPNPAVVPTATIKVVQPQGTPKGTVTLIGPYGSNGWYEKQFTYGPMIVSGLASAGFTAVEFAFNGQYGWMAHGSPGGPRDDVCQLGTVTQWVYNNIHQVGASAPLCATGVSGGASAIAYMLSFYGFGTSASPIFYSMVEMASGPPFGRIDVGCNGASPRVYTSACKLTANPNYDLSAQGLLNSAFANTDCTEHNLSEQQAWLDGSNAAPGAIYSFPSTDVHLLFGGKDAFVAPALGQYWYSQVTSKCSVGCVKDADHLMPNTLDAAQQILGDLSTYCKLQ